MVLLIVVLLQLVAIVTVRQQLAAIGHPQLVAIGHLQSIAIAIGHLQPIAAIAVHLLFVIIIRRPLVIVVDRPPFIKLHLILNRLTLNHWILSLIRCFLNLNHRRTLMILVQRLVVAPIKLERQRLGLLSCTFVVSSSEIGDQSISDVWRWLQPGRQS